MTTQFTYKRFRKSGYSTKDAYCATKILQRFNEIGEDCIRINSDAEQKSYFDVFGEPDGYTDCNGRRVSAEQARKDIERQIELNGCWVVYSEMFDDETNDFEMVDSIGMNSGYNDATSPFENAYVIDLMQSAIDAYDAREFDRQQALETMLNNLP